MIEQLSAEEYASISYEDQIAYYLRLYFESDGIKRAQMIYELLSNFSVDDAGKIFYLFNKIDAGEYEPQKVRIEVEYTDLADYLFDLN